MNSRKVDSEAAPGGHVRLALGSEDDARVCLVESVLCQPHEGSILLHQQDEQSITLHIADLQAFTSFDQAMARYI